MKFSTSSALTIAFIAASTSATPVQRRQASASASAAFPSVAAPVASAVPSASAPAASAVPSGGAVSGGTVGSISSTDIKNAVLAWQSDTSMVSNFLNVAATTQLSDDDLKSDATLANNSEKDELNHKAVLDAQVCSSPNGGCSQSICLPDGNGGETCSSAQADANTVLVTQGTFQSVVNLLGDLSTNGLTALNNGDIDLINNGDGSIGGRCDSVLPAIDAYFAAASQFLISTFNDDSLEGLTAVRPAACG